MLCKIINYNALQVRFRAWRALNSLLLTYLLTYLMSLKTFYKMILHSVAVRVLHTNSYSIVLKIN